MKARILEGELAGIEFTISDETIKNLEEQQRIQNIPNYVNVGQVYKIRHSKYMVACIGEYKQKGNRGLTVVGAYDAGCWSSSILNGPLQENLLRQKLIDLKATYLGKFIDIFEEIN